MKKNQESLFTQENALRYQSEFLDLKLLSCVKQEDRDQCFEECEILAN